MMNSATLIKAATIFPLGQFLTLYSPFLHAFRDGCLNYQEFAVLCRALFRNERDKPYHIEPKSLKEMFDTFDINHVSY